MNVFKNTNLNIFELRQKSKVNSQSQPICPQS